MGYYPDMSSQAAAQGYFADMIRQAIGSAPILQRTTGVPLYVDLGTAISVPNAGNTPVAPQLGGRGIVVVFATWNSGAALANSPRVTTTGSTFTIFNDNATAANCFWLAVAA